MGIFQEMLGAKGQNLLSTLDERFLLDKYFEIFVDYMFFMRKGVQEN